MQEDDSFSFPFSEPTFHVMEGPSFEQSEPVLQRKPVYGPVGTHHQPARAMNFNLQKTCERTCICKVRVVWTPVDTWPPRDQNSKALLMGKEIFGGKGRPRCLPGIYLKKGKREAWDGFPLGTGLSVASVSQEEMARLSTSSWGGN